MFLKLTSRIINLQNIYKIDIKDDKFILFLHTNIFNIIDKCDTNIIKQYFDVIEICKKHNKCDYTLIDNWSKELNKQYTKKNIKSDKKDWFIDI
jgi:hypothetical protein